MRQTLTAILFFLLLSGITAQVREASVALTTVGQNFTAREVKVVHIQSEPQSFRSIGAFILVEAVVNGDSGTYILDTGAPGLMLNKFPGSEAQQAEGFGDQVSIAGTVIEEFSWGPLQQRGVPALLLDLSHFERALHVKIAGLIGYAQLRDLTLTIDYPRRELTFLPDDYATTSLGAPLRFRLRGHVPTMRASVAGRRARLGLDTGSGINLLDEGYRPAALKGPFTSLPEMIVNGLGTGYERVERVSLAYTEIDRASWMNLPFAFTSLSRFRESGLHIDGLLGREWMAQRCITLDYAQRRIFVR